jgi:hypothetical protein
MPPALEPTEEEQKGGPCQGPPSASPFDGGAPLLGGSRRAGDQMVPRMGQSEDERKQESRQVARIGKWVVRSPSR